MTLEITGKLKQFLTPQTGEKKDGSGQWIKQSFLVDTEERYNNLYCFEVFGDEKVENLTKYQKEGDLVTVEFNVSTNEYKGNYYTTLSAWKISKGANDVQVNEPKEVPHHGNFPNNNDETDLPF